MSNPANEKPRTDGVMSPEDRTRFNTRLSNLKQRLGKVRGEPEDTKAVGGNGRNLGYAFRMALDMVAAVVVGGVIGWYLDRWLDTKPVLLLIMIALGLAAGFSNVWRTYKLMQADAGLGTAGQGATGPGQDSADVRARPQNENDD